MVAYLIITLFFYDNFLELIKEQSILYAQQKGCNAFTVTPKELRIIITILLANRCAELPRKRLHWYSSADVNSATLSSSMSRNRFDKILQNLYFAENNNLHQNDKILKLHLFLPIFNEKIYLHYPMEEQLTVDECMAQFYSWHTCKQFIRSKPIRLGNKILAVNTRLGYGYLIQYELYEGAGRAPDFSRVGMGGSVTLDLICELPANKPFPHLL